MPSELLKAAVWGSIWRPQGGLGTLEQIHPPVFPLGVSPRLATNRTRGGPARQSSLYATLMARTSMIVAPRYDRLGSLGDHDPMDSLLARRSARNLQKPVQQQRSPPQTGSQTS